MRVIAGKARRLLLKTVPGFDTRPTIDKIKETLFNVLSPYVEGCNFLDLYSGSGSIGIEALSRGARMSAFVDNNPKAVRVIRENLEHTGLAGDAVVLQKNALAAINELAFRKLKFDIVYVDPPFAKGLYEETLKALAASPIIDDETMVILETDKHETLPFADESGFEITRRKDYKTIKHYFLRLKTPDDAQS